MRYQSQYSKGFTLIEMLTVITIMVLLVTAAIPGWRNFVQNNQAMMLSSKLAGALNFARITAIQTGEQVTICPITQPEGSTCLDTNQWNAWLVFIDKNEDGIYDWDAFGPAQEDLVKYHVDHPPGVITSSISGGIAFNSAGFCTTGSNITFTIVSPGCTGTNGRIITVMPSGNIHVDYTSCS